MTEKQIEYINSVHPVAGQLVRTFNVNDPIRIADIGACECLDSIRYAKMFPNSTIMAFEPRYDNYLKCLDNIESAGFSGRISVENYALNHSVGKQAFFESYSAKGEESGWTIGNKSSSLLNPKAHLHVHRWCKYRKSEVECRTLDSLRKRFDFIHIDVEGAEMRVFKGGRRTLKGATAVWCEVANIMLYSNQVLRPHLMKYMEKAGFRLEVDTCGFGRSGDQLWVKK